MDGGKLQNLSEIACKSCFILKEIAFITTMKKNSSNIYQKN